MRDAFFVACAAAMVLVVASGGVFLALAAWERSGLATWSAEETVTSFGGAPTPSPLPLRLTFTTLAPWVDEMVAEFRIDLTAEPGAGIADIRLGTILVILMQPGQTRPVASVIVSLREAVPNHWDSPGISDHLFTPTYFTGTIELRFHALMVLDYDDRTSASGEWEPAAPLATLRILSNHARTGLFLLITGGSLSATATFVAWLSRRAWIFGPVPPRA